MDVGVTDKIIIASEINELPIIREFIVSHIADAKLNEKERANVEFSVIEAVMNAIVHGNEYDRGKKIEVTYSGYPDRIEIKVKDSGAGFDPSKLPDPREPESLKAPSGRGVFFMRQMMSKVEFEFSPEGATVILTKML